MTTYNADASALQLQLASEPSSSSLQVEVSKRFVIGEEDIVGTMTTDYIIVDLADEGDDIELGACPSIYDDVLVVSDNFAGNLALCYEHTGEEADADAIVAQRAQRIEDEDDSIRELATTGDGV